MFVILSAAKNPLGRRWQFNRRNMPPIHRSYWVYFLTNHPHGTLYIGVTNSLQRRIGQHKSLARDGFSKRYGLNRLVYFEEFRDVRNAIARETELKGWLRKRKIELIKMNNPLWRDLASDWSGGVSLDSSLRSE
jgi:putative endonuclease